VLVTAGASAALQRACLALFEPGDEVLLADPSYPCNRHFVTAAGATPRLLACGPEARFQPTALQIEAAWTPATRGVLLASPGNPTGTSIAHDELLAIARAVRARGGVLIVDEIYLGLSYDEAYGASALALPDGLGDEVVTIHSFSKYFGMTGWRLGWLTLPPALVGAVEKLAQNLYICPPTLAQHAALACFAPESLAEYERRRAEFRARRDWVVPALADVGLPVPVLPDGAFYAWADVSGVADSSWELAFRLMDQAHVALTPGRDFGPAAAERYLRLSFASALPQLQEAVRRIGRVLGG
jgi:aspartate/methionine/tyrosine aminotransferase